jgi:DNA-binding CsgD family transcriptional regulator/tetratricopeptide (TPR) repeat protein
VSLHGREAERAALDAVLSSGSGALVLRGEAGIGKTALLGYAAASACGHRVLRASGSESEAELPFAGVHQLIRPLLDRSGELPEEQAAALRSIGSPRADRFAVSAAVLDLLARSAEREPLLCIVDDAHRLDRASLAALAFVARRLRAERIVLLLATRDAADGLPELVLGALDREAAGRLLDGRLDRAAAPLVRERLLDAAAGNPLALRELPAALSAEQLAGRERTLDPLPVTHAVERTFLPDVARLDERVQTLLLVVAADGGGDLAVVRHAAARLGVTWDDFDDAESAGAIRTSTQAIELTHPLLASVVYHAATIRDRRRVHAVLAEAHAEPDRRAWHRAAAAVGGDDELAGELERTAAHAARRRGPGAAGAVLERAAEVTSDDTERARRLVAAAEAFLLAGRPARAGALAREAQALAVTRTLRAEIRRLHALIELRQGAPADALAELLAAADEIAALDESRGTELLFEAAEIARSEADAQGQLEVARRTAAIREPSFELDVTVGVGEILAGRVARGTQLVREALGAHDLSMNTRRLAWAGEAALQLGDPATARRFFTRLVAELREQDAAGLVPVGLQWLALAEAADGRLAAATARSREGLRLAGDAELTNCRCHHLAILAWTAALRGRTDECRAAADDVFRIAETNGLGLPVQIATAALGELELGLGRPDEALARLSDVSSHLVRLLVAPSLVELAARSDRRELAASLVGELETWIDDDAPAGIRALLERCRGLLAEGDAADRHYDEALRLHAVASRAFDQARTRLLYGEALRRTRRRREARTHLQAALDGFERLQAESWAKRARSELRGSGLTAQRGDPSLVDRLTPQELQVARLVATGSTNKQVAAQLFLSPRTIDFHLRNIFAKLGITSRFQLSALRAEIETGDVAGATLQRAA